MVNILVVGGAGQLGRQINAWQSLSGNGSGFSLFFTDVDTLDITDGHSVEKFIDHKKIDVLINCAAYTNVDRAETDILIAEQINHHGVRSLAQACIATDTTMIHISTDYVFNGQKRSPYLETDPTDPIGIYGATKLRGEQAMVDCGCKGVIIRTSWLYSCYGNNFVKTMMRLGAERESLNVVDDQRGTPTYAGDITTAIMERIIPSLLKSPKYGEIYQFSNTGEATWCSFARKIMKLASLPCRVDAVTSDQYPSLVKRPLYSVLSKDKIIKDFDVIAPYWEDSLEKCIKLLVP